MASIILFNKPFMVLSQFTDDQKRSTLADYITDDKAKGFYPAGRLDRDSEGLLILTNDGSVQSRIAHPKHKLAKTYWVQVEGLVTDAALQNLQDGVELNDGPTQPARAKQLTPPENLWPREPPIRERVNQPTSWLELTITEGRNRQVRRMTAAVGLPTLRLIRVQIGPWKLAPLVPGEYSWASCNLPSTGKTTPPRPKIRPNKTNKSKSRSR